MHSTNFVSTFWRHPIFAATGAALLSGALLSGCGGNSDTPELGGVHGRVTLDGEPLPDASLRFQPVDGGRLALATTDENGYYKLQYTQEASGAILGKHIVRIFTGQDGYDDGEQVHPPVPEKVPVQYNIAARDNPEMVREIKSGSQEINFALTSDGEKVQREDVPVAQGGR